MKHIMNIEQSCKFYGCSKEQLKSQYIDNLAGINKMLIKAIETGKTVNGYTINKLKDLVNEFTMLINQF